MTQKAHCDIVGVTDPFITVLARQMGMEGFNVAAIASSHDLEFISSVRFPTMRKNITPLIGRLTSKICSTFDATHRDRYSPASRARLRLEEGHGALTPERLATLQHLRQPTASTHQVLRGIEKGWESVDTAAKWLKKLWDFDKQPINDALMSTFYGVFKVLLSNSEMLRRC